MQRVALCSRVASKVVSEVKIAMIRRVGQTP